jgi:ATP-binding cassette subfamily B multidrug efflux pump
MLTNLIVTYLSRYRRYVAAVVVLQFIATAAMLYLPTLNADIIDNGVAKGDTEYILRIGGWMLVVASVQVLCMVIAQFFGARGALGVGRDLRHDLLHRVNTFSAREVGTFGAPSLITRSTNDVQQIQLLLVMGAAILVMAPIMCIGGIVMWHPAWRGFSWWRSPCSES